jgi:Putative methyltransferase
VAAPSVSVKDWVAWHGAYDDPNSGLSWRLGVIRRWITRTLDNVEPGPARVVSLCAGQGRDLIGAVADHPRRDDVVARLVELDSHNAKVARDLARAEGLSAFDIVTGNASNTSAFTGAVPADLVLVCGVFGNISDADIERTVVHLPALAAPGATVIWTRHRLPPDMTPSLRRWFTEAGFEELAFEVLPAGVQSVGVHRLVVPPLPFETDLKLFEFIDDGSSAGTGR